MKINMAFDKKLKDRDHKFVYEMRNKRRRKFRDVL